MFKDMALSRDLVTTYRESMEYRSPPPGDKGKRKAGSEDGPKASFMVLQASSWPFTPKGKDADLPPYVSNRPIPNCDSMRPIALLQMSEQLSRFTEFYKKKHGNRVLNWDHALGNASVTGYFKGGKKELLVSLYQAIVLLQFDENAGGIRYNEIKTATRMRESCSVIFGIQVMVTNRFVVHSLRSTAEVDLKRTLQSLACGKQKVLKKRPVGAEVDESDAFYFNDDYTNPRHQIRIDSIQAKETVSGIVLSVDLPIDHLSGGPPAGGKQTYRGLDRG